jgi:hypothetical protein
MLFVSLQMSEDQKIFARRIQLTLKIVELGLAIICVGLIVDPINHKMQLNMHHVGLVYVTYAGFIFINTIVIIGQLKSERIPQLMVRASAASNRPTNDLLSRLQARY